MKSDLEIRVDAIANHLFFLGCKAGELQALMDKHNLEFRKGKGIPDIKKAREKACKPKNGHFKVEYEESMFALYLRIDVFKMKRKAG